MLDKIGAGWKKKNENGSFISCICEFIHGMPVNVLIMPYEPKEGTEKTENSPDYTILLIKPDNKKNDKKEKDEGDLI